MCPVMSLSGKSSCIVVVVGGFGKQSTGLAMHSYNTVGLSMDKWSKCTHLYPQPEISPSLYNAFVFRCSTHNAIQPLSDVTGVDCTVFIGKKCVILQNKYLNEFMTK